MREKTASEPGRPQTVFIERDAAWSGEVRVPGVVVVRKGVTLRILPGTRVLFASTAFSSPDSHLGFTGPGIRVEGRIVAEGSEDGPIVFTTAEGAARPGMWDKILFDFSVGSRFVRCTFEGARYAFHAHYSEIEIARCLFRENEEGVRLGVSRVTIEGSVFTRNAVRGINFRECRNVIRGNLVFGNGDGVFLHSKNVASRVSGNAVYSNRGYNVRMGDLHEDDIDLSGNWWGTLVEEEARRKVFDVRNQPGVGAVRLSPMLSRPPVTGAQVRGVFAVRLSPVAGGVVRAYASAEKGFFGEDYVAEATTDADGIFRLALPPGRYFIVGRAEVPAGTLFAFTGRNPVSVSLGDILEVGLPAVAAPPRSLPAAAASRTSIAVRTTLSGSAASGVTVQAFRSDAPDLRGTGEAASLTDAKGEAVLYLPPGRYVFSARKRAAGPAIGRVDEGGLFGVYPFSPVELPPGSTLAIEIPLFEKRGLLDDADGDAPAAHPSDLRCEGTATLSGEAAHGYIVFFYRPPETIGRPEARSSVVSPEGRFTVLLPAEGEYLAFLRRSVSGLPGDAGEERIGPVSIRMKEGRFHPPSLSFPPP
jgi:hypothetical protein